MIEADGVSRIGFDYSNVCVEKLDFDVNYRSAQKVLDFSIASLDLPGSSCEVGSVSCVGDVVELSSGNPDFDEFSDIEFVKADSRENEINFILHKINSIVGSKMIADSKTGGSRLVKYSDIAILSRTRTFGLDILKKCEEAGCPAVYDGGIYLFLEEASIVLLAWAKLILDVDCRSSWITILEKENLPYLEIERIINDKSYPSEMIEFRNHLLGNRRVISYIVDEVFRKYGFNDEISNQIVLILDNLFNSTLISLSDLVVFIEECITNNSDFRVEISNCIDSVKIQTIHGSKGLEYPIVFVVNCNLANFPMNSRGSLKLFYDKSCGIRCKDEFSSEHNYIFDSWKSDLLSYKLNSDYDEERRLMYVAVTRAMFDVYITSYRPSTFFTEFSCSEFMDLSDNFKYNLKFPKQISDNFDTELKISDFDDKGISKTVSAHNVMGEITVSGGGRGMNFGNTIHNLAFRYVTKLKISKVDKIFEKDFNNVKTFVDSLLFSNVWGEENCLLKLSDLVLVSGIVDCVFELDDKILIVDWKTDVSKENIYEYRKQLSIYYHVLVESFDKPIETCIFWTYFGESEKIEPMSLNELGDLI
jgi:ATP-dependent exoDNAse (exonuclease V) beta subunit